MWTYGIYQDILKRATSKRPTCQKLAFQDKLIVSAILTQLCSDDSIQILLRNQFSIFLSHIRLQKQHSSLMNWLKICKTWVRSQLRWAWNWLKLKVTSSNVLRIIIHWLSVRRDVGLTQGSLTPKEHSLYRALNCTASANTNLTWTLSKTKQPLPIITNSHLNFRYLTASANL